MGGSSLSDLLRRKAATENTLAKYRDKPFSWKDGHTCLHMLRFHLRQMGHKPETLPRIRSAIGARRALGQRGWKDVGDMLDTLLPRITPAAMWLGDVALFQSGDGFGSIMISVGEKVLGWSDGYVGMTPHVPLDIAGAWRV